VVAEGEDVILVVLVVVVQRLDARDGHDVVVVVIARLGARQVIEQVLVLACTRAWVSTGAAQSPAGTEE
jgi:hypothetical protein